MSKTAETPLLLAVRTLSDDLQHFEQLSTELARLVINSEKSLQRARKGLQECSEHEAKLAQSLRGFADAMQVMQSMQQRCMDQTAAATERIKQRQEERAQLQQRMQSLADNARDVSAPVEALPDPAVGAPGVALAPLQDVARRLELVIAEAAEVTELARRGEWADLERDTHSLEQQLQSARNRVLLGLRKLASDAPS